MFAVNRDIDPLTSKRFFFILEEDECGLSGLNGETIYKEEFNISNTSNDELCLQMRLFTLGNEYDDESFAPLAKKA
jgi:hypothetical protein